MAITSFKLHFQELKSDRLFIWTSIISLVNTILTTLVLMLTWNQLPPTVPFFYSLPWGIEQLAPTYLLFVLSGVGFLVLLLNFFFSMLVKPVSLFFARILLIGATTCSIMLSITIINIILLMT